MTSAAFDTLKLAQRLEAAGFPPKQAQDVASAIAETIAESVVTRDYLDLRLGEVRAEIGALRGEMLSLNADTLKWIFGAVGLQTVAILGGVAALFKLLGH